MTCLATILLEVNRSEQQILLITPYSESGLGSMFHVMDAAKDRHEPRSMHERNDNVEGPIFFILWRKNVEGEGM